MKQIDKRKILKIETPEGFVEDFPHMSNKALEAKYGISRSTTWLLQRRHKLHKTSECRSASARVRRRRRIITDENLERFLELAPTHTNYELAQIFNLTTVQAGCVRRRYGNTCSPELRARAYAEMGIRMGERRKRRIALGLDPDYFTRDYKKMNTDKLLSKGYIVDEEASVAYWDEKTRRSKIMETRQTYYTFQQWTPEIAKQYEN